MVNKKGQEEMVGLVIIMVVVAVIFLVFLGIFIRQGNSQDRTSGSAEVAQFLDSAVEFTSECTFNDYSYLDVGELFRACDSGNALCRNGKKACVVLEETLKNMLDASWNFDENSPLKGYELKAVNLRDSSSTPLPLNPIFKGPCGTNRRGNDKSIFAQSGSIIVSLELCLD